jgi:signal peptidase I
VIGIPGDTIQIKNGQIYVEGNLFPLPITAKYHYTIYLKALNEKMNSEFDIKKESYHNYGEAFLSITDSIHLMHKYGIIDSIKKGALKFNNQVLLTFKMI